MKEKPNNYGIWNDYKIIFKKGGKIFNNNLLEWRLQRPISKIEEGWGEDKLKMIQNTNQGKKCANSVNYMEGN